MYINFTTSHTLTIKSKIVIRSPSGLKLPANGTVIDVIGLMTDSSTPKISTPAT